MYREIAESDYRGDGYFDAVIVRDGHYIRRFPSFFARKFAWHLKNDKVVIKRLRCNDDWFEVIGYNGGDALPSYANYKYYIHSRHLKDLKRRPIIKLFSGLDSLIKTGYMTHEPK